MRQDRERAARLCSSRTDFGRSQPTSANRPPAATAPSDGAAYLNRVIDRGARQLAQLTGGRKRALAAPAYQAGGLLVMR
jgi:hypothetical protein